MSDTQKNAQDVTSQLWSMANELRGNMDASEFRNYILGFMFYRYLSDRQESFLNDQGLLDAEGNESLNDTYKREAAGDDLADYLKEISSVLGYAISPNFTWATIVEKIENDELVASDFQDMFDEFNKNAVLNVNAENDFDGIFADINLSNSRLGNNTSTRARALTNVVKMVNSFDYNDENGHDILGDIYEYLIAQFAGNSGKKAGEFYTPHEVSEVLAKIVTLNVANDDKPFSVYDPAMGSGSLLLTVGHEVNKGDVTGRVRYSGQELNTTTYNLGRMNLMMHGVKYDNMTLANGDSLESDWPDGADEHGVDHPRSFDAIVENPPYSAHWDNQDNKMKDARFKDYGALAPKTKADYAFLLHGLYHLNPEGTMAIVLPHGVLFRGAKEEKIRRSLLEKNQIDAIIGMPAGLFYSTGIPTVVMVLKKQRENKDVLFIDASSNFEKGKNQNILSEEDIDRIIDTYKERKGVDKFAHVATLDEIKDNDFNLNIPRYVDTFEPEPEIDIKQVKADIADLDTQIAEVEKEFAEMESQLVETRGHDDDK
ncbi:type I restriction-modification system subunit M [Companilactobacillus mishanensis]|uniref:site-specific DNA-methyltransferase (adenine-specific) n=1 Tax=Companilactobacillus mishanensis TaxID=2486008 RepID=A0A5P0ZJ48_9LACO|nr:type I restriction-modification system subunit M [Companilactobacillus mishanensis]MQS53131.1 type I restriction-modification system subunit M [Companilactobacillus mishanensis]